MATVLQSFPSGRQDSEKEGQVEARSQVVCPTVGNHEGEKVTRRLVQVQVTAPGT
jgi:hypothetical protein